MKLNYFHMCFDDAFDFPMAQYPEKSVHPWIKCARGGKLIDYWYTDTNDNEVKCVETYH